MTLHHLPRRVQFAAANLPKVTGPCGVGLKAGACAPATPSPACEWKAPPRVDDLMVFILKAQRAHDTPGEKVFCKALRERLIDAGHEVEDHVFDQFSVTIPAPGGARADTLFCCHVDTCDGRGAAFGGTHWSEEGYKTLTYDPGFGLIGLADDSPGGCLGADDGTGVWMLMKMIEARVPGTYLFHRGEECGGLGAKEMARHEADWLRQFNVAVEFDRAGYTDIVTHQRGGVRCASDKFAEVLSERLKARHLPMQPCTRGVYTDVYEYRGLIAECVNLSVGYHNQHGRQEDQDYGFACALLDAATRIDWLSLPVDRDPAAQEPARLWPGVGQPSWVFGRDDEVDEDEDEDEEREGDTAALDALADTLLDMPDVELQEWVCGTPPEEVAQTLQDVLRDRRRLRVLMRSIADTAGLALM